MDRESWIKISEKRAKKYLDNAEDANKVIKKHYEIALEQIQKEIADFYMRYANENQLSYNESVKILSSTDLSRFKRNINKYIDVGNDPDLVKEFKAISLKQRITRLEALMANIKTECSKLEAIQQNEIGQCLKETFRNNCEDVLHELKDDLGINISFAFLNPKTIEEAVNYPWSGEMFSERLWNNRKNLVRSIKQELTQGLIQGKSVQDMARNIAKTMGTNYKAALVIARTETAYVVNQSTIKGYEESGVVGKIEFLSTIDDRTSSICHHLNGDVIELSIAKVGVNIPPMHPNCRSTIIPCFEK